MSKSSGIAGLGGISGILMLLVLMFGMGPGCTQLGLNTASRSISGDEGELPAIAALSAEAPLEHWEQIEAPRLKSEFEALLYGPIPKGIQGRLVSRKTVDATFSDGAGVLEELVVSLGDDESAPRFHLALALPAGASADNPAPLILAQSFCDNRATMASDGLSPPADMMGPDCTNSFIGPVIKLIFGAHIATAPVEQILARGYALASMYPSEIVPDSKSDAPAALESLSTLVSPGTEPQSALAVWAAAFGWALDAIEGDKRIAADKTVAWGHSRYGKAALIAGAFVPSVEGVIAHQSGTGGATLSRSLAGESVAQITNGYPHWFASSYASYGDREAELPIDQHQLIALVAPKPMLLGNGWKDVWSDPNGTFRAALSADPVYELYGRDGLVQAGLDDGDYLSGELGFQIRAGAHGIRKTDWRSFLDWMDRWFPAG